MWGVIPAAGRGTRLAGLTRGEPKPLLEVAGTPLLVRLLDQLVGLVERVCIVIPAGDDRIPARLGKRHGSLELDYVVQDEPRGVGHAIGRAGSVVEGSFMVVMGDAFYDRGFEGYLTRWRASGKAGAVLLEPPRAADQRQGRVRVVEERIVDVEKTTGAERFTHGLAGSVIVPEEALGILRRGDPAPSGEVELEPAVSALLAQGHEFEPVVYRGWRTNINRPEDLVAVLERIEPDGEGGPLDADRGAARPRPGAGA